jgi:tRNA(Ile)-lysidine synthetase-like protein
MHNIDNYFKRVGKTCSKYRLLEPDDKILIGLSGGKDSLFLMEALAELKRHLQFSVNLFACHVHVQEIGYLVDFEYLKGFSQKLDIPLFFEEISIDRTLNPGKSACFVCSWHRRKRLFELTKKYNCNKLALGHHLDDAIETLLINMVYHGSISSLPQKLKMFNGRINLIRPLIELTQEDMLKIASLRKYPALKNECPYNDQTRRMQMRQMVLKFAEMNRLAKKNIFRSMSNIYEEYIPVVSNRKP